METKIYMDNEKKKKKQFRPWKIFFGVGFVLVALSLLLDALGIFGKIEPTEKGFHTGRVSVFRNRSGFRCA